MEDYPHPEEARTDEGLQESRAPKAAVWIAVLVVLALVAVAAAVYGSRQHAKAVREAAQANELNTTVSQLQDQVNALNSKLSEVTTEQQQAAEAEKAREEAAARPAEKPRVRHTASVRRHAAPNNEVRQLQSQLATQQQQLNDLQGQVAKTRTDLEGDLSSTRDQLNGSIAKNHDELVALEKRGQRNYFEFDLTKSKEFQRSGPLMLSLRHADTKHDSYDLAMIVDDNKISKKHVSLYEPIWLHADDDVQPMQVVVNEISKNHVHGYVSAPKFSETRQVSAAVTPAAAAASAGTPAANASAAGASASTQ